MSISCRHDYFLLHLQQAEAFELSRPCRSISCIEFKEKLSVCERMCEMGVSSLEGKCKCELGEDREAEGRKEGWVSQIWIRKILDSLGSFLVCSWISSKIHCWGPLQRHSLLLFIWSVFLYSCLSSSHCCVCQGKAEADKEVLVCSAHTQIVSALWYDPAAKERGMPRGLGTSSLPVSAKHCWYRRQRGAKTAD